MKKTIYDVANALGVAPSTVSKALNNAPGVSAKMRRKVQKYASEIRYFPNATASKLKTKKSYAIGIVFSEQLNIGLEHNFFSRILQAFKTYVEKEGYEISFVISNYAKQDITYLEFCVQKNISGVLILACLPDDPHITELINSSVHCVSTDTYSDNLFTVMSDNRTGAALAVRFFVERGHTRVAYISGPKEAIACREREEGYRNELISQGLQVDENLIIESKEFSFEHGHEAAYRFMELDSYPSAVFVASDEIAMGFTKCLRSNGLRIPQDVQIIGFDDIPFVQYFEPSLSTLRQNTTELGVSAAKKLIDLMDAATEEKTGVKYIPVELIERESTK